MYDFDEVIERENTNALSVDGFKRYVFKDNTIELPYIDDEVTKMWLAEMEFATPDFIIEEIKKRLDKKFLVIQRITPLNIMEYSQIGHKPILIGIFQENISHIQ